MSPVIKRIPDFDAGKTFIIKDVIVDWASVFRPNTKYRPEWAVVIRVPEHLQQEFYEVGFRLKQDANGTVTLRAKRYVRLDDGTEMSPPVVVDCENKPWPEQRGLIGNGSRCNVKVRAKYTTYQGVEGLSCFLEGLQVIDHVPYAGGSDFSPVAGTTGGWSDSNFTAQPPPQQPQQPPQQSSSFAPPPQQPQQPQSTAFVPPGVPQGVPHGGNVSQPPAGALSGGYSGPPADEEDEGQDWAPPQHSTDMGDVPF